MRKNLRPVHPGEFLNEEFLKPRGLGIYALALDLHVPTTRITELVRQRRAISRDDAERLARYFNTTPAFWLNLQSKFDLDVGEDSAVNRAGRKARPRESS
jgi:antitoxin HigA-1